MRSCPNFECLAYSRVLCSRYPGCEGCSKEDFCDVCENQSRLISGVVVPCDLRSLSFSCRFCEARRSDGFHPDQCQFCPLHETNEFMK